VRFAICTYFLIIFIPVESLNFFTSKFYPIFLHDSLTIAPNYLSVIAKIVLYYVATCFGTS
jgi:hypothetical protein